MFNLCLMDARQREPVAAWQPLLTLLMILFALCLPAAAQANMGVPYTGGQLAAEPTGLAEVAIIRETLTIDLQGLASNGFAQVEAVYAIHNEGATHTVDLLFVTGADQLRAFGVWLNDLPVPSQAAPDSALPASWQPPQQTPGLHGADAIFYPGAELAQRAVPMRFTVELLPGPQTIRVRYQAEATSNRSANQPTRYWQFSYILAPARTWASFGGLDLTIVLPPGWNAATVPALSRDGDRLIGSFAELPAAALAMTVQAPAGWLYWLLFSLGWLIFGLALLGGAFFCWQGGRARGRTAQAGWPLALGLGLLWALAVLLTGFFLILAPPAVIAPQQAGAYGYGSVFAGFGVVLLSVLLLVVGFLITMITMGMVRRRAV